jgi:hypothetical protein
MGQYVLEVGSTSIDIFRKIVEQNVTGQSSLDILDWEHRESMIYAPSDLPVSAIMQGLSAQSFASAVWRDGGSGVRYVLLYCPHFSDSSLGLWLCTIEYTDETWRELWSELGAYPSVRFACVSQDEGLIISDDHLSPNTFPWSDRSLIVAAVRSASEAWVSRESGYSSEGRGRPTP